MLTFSQFCKVVYSLTSHLSFGSCEASALAKDQEMAIEAPIIVEYTVV